ncbi:MAG: hypothetical protein ACF8Q5_08710 [Phycisphaerales bacterium JB040]
MTSQRFVCGVALAISCLLTHTTEARAGVAVPQICGFDRSQGPAPDGSSAGNPTYAWLWLSNYLHELDHILYGEGVIGLALEVPTHPYAIQANLDAERFVLTHRVMGTPAGLDDPSRQGAADAARKVLELLSAYPELLSPENQSSLTRTCTTILDDLGV